MRISDWSSDVCSSDLFRKPYPNSCRRLLKLMCCLQCCISCLMKMSSSSINRVFEGSIKGLAFTMTFKRSEEHTSELQSLMRISYAVFCLKKTTHSYQYKIKSIFFRIT